MKKSLYWTLVRWLSGWFEEAIYVQPDGLSGDGHHRLEFCEFAEVLGGSCEGKFVLDATWATQSEPVQPEDAFEMGEQHFHLLSPPLSGRVELGTHAAPGKITDNLILLSADCARIAVGAAFGF